MRVDSGDTSQDSTITDLLTAARVAVENYTNRALTNTTITWLLDADEMRTPIWVPVGDASSVTSVTLYDGKAGASDTVVSTANYELVGNKIVTRADGFSSSQTHGAGEIVYVAGYGANATDVPLPLKTAILMWISATFEYREGFIAGTILAPMPQGVKEIIHDNGYCWGWH